MRSRLVPAWVAALDLALELVLVAFAVYSVVHLAGAELGWSVRTTGLAWLMAAAPVVVAGGWWGWRVFRTVLPDPPDPSPDPSPDSPPLAGGRRGRVLQVLTGPRAAPVLLAGAVLAAAGMALGGVAFTVGWLVGTLVAALGVVVVAARFHAGPTEPAPPPPDAWVPPRVPERLRPHLPHLLAALLAVAVGVFVLFVLNQSRDDVFYVNRAAWVAERGTFPERDTMFGPLTYPTTYGAGLPIAALEEAYGTVARLLGLRAATVAYLLLNPLAAAAAVWATWRLVRAWAPRRHLLVLLVAVALPLTTGAALIGEFGYVRLWQGKVVVLLVVLPIVWVHLTRLLRHAPAPWWSVTMLLALGVAWSGLTVTSPIFGVVVMGLGLVAALLLPWGRLPAVAGAVALGLAPLAVGVATVLTSDGPVAEEAFVSDPEKAWLKVFGDDRLLLAVVALALLVGPHLARGVSARLLAALTGLLTFVMLVPGVFSLLDTVTGAGPIAVRLLLLAPVPVLVGLLAAAPLPDAVRSRGPRTSRWTAVLPAGVVLAVLAVSGTPVWSAGARASLEPQPTWKVKPWQKASVEALLAEFTGPGPVVLPPQESRVLAITTTRLVSVVPRDYYVQFLEEPKAQRNARFALRRLMDPGMRDPRPEMLLRSLDALDVTLVCSTDDDARQIALLREVGLAGERPIGDMVCFDGPGTVPVVTPPAGRAPAR